MKGIVKYFFDEFSAELRYFQELRISACGYLFERKQFIESSLPHVLRRQQSDWQNSNGLVVPNRVVDNIRTTMVWTCEGLVSQSLHLDTRDVLPLERNGRINEGR